MTALSILLVAATLAMYHLAAKAPVIAYRAWKRPADAVMRLRKQQAIRRCWARLDREMRWMNDAYTKAIAGQNLSTQPKAKERAN